MFGNVLIIDLLTMYKKNAAKLFATQMPYRVIFGDCSLAEEEEEYSRDQHELPIFIHIIWLHYEIE